MWYGICIKAWTDYIQQIWNESENLDNPKVPKNWRHAFILIQMQYLFIFNRYDLFNLVSSV